jgi:ribonucleoside-diphosphate reductase alpha chain
VIAPTGTIGFMMDCDTTGIEPELALVKYKKLVGGGVIKIVNNTVPQALIRLGYSPEQVESIVNHIDATAPSKARPISSPSTWPSSIAASGPPTARASSTTWATSA